MRILLVVFMIISTLVGCSGVDVPNEPPLPTISANGKNVDVYRGSYCWRVKNNGKCVDMAAPFDFPYEPTVIGSGSEATITFDYEPKEDSLHYVYWMKGETTERPSKEGIIVDNKLILPTEEGIYYYAIDASFNEGNPSYVMIVEIPATEKK